MNSYQEEQFCYCIRISRQVLFLHVFRARPNAFRKDFSLVKQELMQFDTGRTQLSDVWEAG